MKIQEVEMMLKYYNKTLARIDILRKELESIGIAGLSAIKYDGVSSKNSDINKPTEKQAMRLIEYKEAVETDLFLLENKIYIINKAIGQLNKMQKTIITKRLVNNETWTKICSDMHISERYGQKIKKTAVLKILDLIDARGTESHE